MLYGQELIVFVLGEQWAEAGEYATILSFLGFALVLRGLINIIHINERRAQSLAFLYLCALLIIYPISIGLQWIYNLSLYEFVMVYAGANFTYWLAVLTVTIRKLSIVSGAHWKSFFFIVSLAGIFSSTGLLMKQWIAWPWYAEILAVPCLALGVALSVIYIFLPDTSKALIRFVKSRIDFGQFRSGT